MEYCNNATVLPPPINIVSVLVDFVVCCCSLFSSLVIGFEGADATNAKGGAKKRKYAELVKTLALKYENDFEDSEENDATKEHLDKLSRDLKKLSTENGLSVREDIDGIAKMMRDLGKSVEELKVSLETMDMKLQTKKDQEASDSAGKKK